MGVGVSAPVSSLPTGTANQVLLHGIGSNWAENIGVLLNLLGIVHSSTNAQTKVPTRTLQCYLLRAQAVVQNTRRSATVVFA